MLASKVFVPKITDVDLLDLVKNKTKKQKRKFENQILKRIKQSDYLIIHFTLLEILIGTTEKLEIKKWLDDFITTNDFDNKKKVLVLISGRGKPSNLPKGFYFANYTTIADCVGSSRSKLRLVNILKSLRK